MINHQVEILLVEDNINDAELTIRALKKINLSNSLFHVSDGAEAIDFVFAQGKYAGRNMDNKPKVVLLDLHMPKVGGLEVLQILKSSEKTKDIPVVVMTSSKEQRDLVSSYQLGVNSYVLKPVSFDAFAKAVAELGLYWVVVNQTPQS